MTTTTIRSSSSASSSTSSSSSSGMNSSTSTPNIPTNAPLNLSNNRGNLLRVCILFTLGSMLGLVLNILQMEYKSNLFPSYLLLFLKVNWWVIPLCGLAGVYIGFCYPILDHMFGHCHHNDRDWTVIIRCCALFIGLNHLCAKIQFANTSHFLMILLTFCIVFWYWFDKTKFGLIFNIVNALSVIMAVHFLRYLRIYNFSQIQLDYLQSCLLCLIFSGGVTFGNIGRLLDFYDTNHSLIHHMHVD